MSSLFHNMFLEETKDQIDYIEKEFLKLEKNGYDDEIIVSTLRMAHSIKGVCNTLNFSNMAKISHLLENVLVDLKDGKTSIQTVIIDILFKLLDSLKKERENISLNKKESLDIKKLTAEVESLYSNLSKNEPEDILKEESKQEEIKMQEKEIKKLEEEKVERQELKLEEDELFLVNNVVEYLNIYKIAIYFSKGTKMKSGKAFLIINNLLGIGEIVQTTPNNYENLKDEEFSDAFFVILATRSSQKEVYENINVISEIEDIGILNIREGKGIDKKKNFKNLGTNKNQVSSVRINMNDIDELLNLMGEFVIDRQKLFDISKSLKRKYGKDEDIIRLNDNLRKIEFITSKMENIIMASRMLPLEYIFSRYERLVRDLSKKLNKNIKIEVYGEKTKIDRNIIEALVEPITHIVRNSIDHGIEDIEERKKSNKSEVAKIVIGARREKDNALIEIKDDGRGINFDKIKEKIRKETFDNEKMEELSEKSLLNYIFESGFTTSKKINELSGRGIGLEIVNREIGKLNGIVDVKTKKNIGTKFIIKVPITLKIIKALLVEICDFRYAIPSSLIIEIIKFKEKKDLNKHLEFVDGKYYYFWKDKELINVLNLANYMSFDCLNTQKTYLIILGHSEKRFGIIVPNILRNENIVIKDLTHFMGKDKIMGENLGILGVSTLGDGGFAQVLDIASLVKEL
ncbi:chemotaxis protein CheA [Peptostreptococcaceae bacterium AGR-M142]